MEISAYKSGKWVPEDYDLGNDFKLTSFSGLKGWGCKVPQKVLLKLLEGVDPSLQDGSIKQHNDVNSPFVGEKIA